MLKNIAVLFCMIMAAGTVQAKELTNRLGVGVKSNASIGIAELAAVYYPVSELAVVGGLGIDTEKDNSKFTANAGVRRIVFKEDNLNFYMGGALGLVNLETGGNKESGFEINALFGAEFFLPGLENLGFTFEGGVGVVSLDDVRFKTIGNGPFSAGIVFYF
ncbi:organic solvent tolerance protein [Bdellovibrio reynosensis]|uniref:Organic solvent tolerance protein n=1 Tax=Bdellovibrio reynosensis TaxID=2835041 RepID=A0ABY4CCL9_9BACT|nr:organic solvent tolerance protein [Bdellovibrio reynosensis]UOF02189.1 organic solvent tolerance protein [Bdellovibrio reynosensis]